MAKPDIKNARSTGIIVLLIAVAYGIRFLPVNGYGSEIYGFLIHLFRSVIYVGLFAAWGFSAHRRVIQPQVRNYLTAISVLLVFWIVVRAVKYMPWDHPHFSRYLWYSYYIPQIGISLMLVLIACSLGKQENYRLPKWTNILYVVSAVLLGLILTNDMHQLAFRFLKGYTYIANGEYTHEIVYFLVLAWIVFCIVAMLLTVYCKCRVPGSRKRIWLPCIPLLMLAVYWAMYIWAYSVLDRLNVRDFTAVSCLLCIGTLESFIRCRLIPSNTNYNCLFHIGNVGAVITDEKYEQIIASDNYVPVSRSTLEEATQAPMVLDNDMRLSSSVIENGFIFWVDDVSELSKMIAKLRELNHTLTIQNETAQKEYETDCRRRQTKEKKRLYEQMLSQCEKDIRLYVSLAEKLKEETDQGAVYRMVCRMAVVLAYIKRRLNLVFLLEENDKISAEELGICIGNDSLPCIRQSGVICELTGEIHGLRDISEITFLYESFHGVIMAAFDTLRTLTVHLSEQEGKIVMTMHLTGETDLNSLASDRIHVKNNKDEWLLTICDKGGACR